MDVFENVSVKVEDTWLSVTDDALNKSNFQLAGLQVEFKAEIADVKSEAVPLSANISPFISVQSSSNNLSSANVEECKSVGPLPEVARSDTSGSGAVETNIIIKKEEDINSDENVFEVVMESHFGISTDKQDNGECHYESFPAKTVRAEARESLASEQEPKVCSSSSDTDVWLTNMRCKSEEQPFTHLQKSITYHGSSHTLVRDVRVVLVDILPKCLWNMSTNATVNHIDSKSCLCALCAGKFKLPAKMRSRNLMDRDNSGDSTKLGVEPGGENCESLRDGKWYLCAVCPARFIFAHNLARHALMDHQARLCLVCCIKFECDSDLEMHAEMHPEKKQYSCLFCNFKSEREVDMEVHLKTHSGSKCFSCAKCKVEFQECYTLVNHIKENDHKRQLTHKGATPKLKTKRESKEKVLSCTYCPAKYKFGCRLRDHMMYHTNEKPFVCPHCPAKFVTPFFLNSHLMKHSSEAPFPCTICPAKFKRSRTLEEHLLFHNNLKPHSCLHCERTFTSKGARNRHMKTHTEEYVCPYCNKKYSTARYLKEHCLSHGNERPYSCSRCHASFKVKKYLLRHLRSHTNAVKIFTCEQCSAKFRFKSLLRVHLMNHSGERPYKCDHCDSTFKTKACLMKHIVIHYAARPFKCGECDAAFKSAREVLQHRKTHSSDRPFECDLCPASFRTKGSLGLHRKIHTREALFTCAHCDLRFHTKQEILGHSCIRSARKPYSCRHCSAEFRYKCRLKEHLLLTHRAKKLYLCSHCPAKFKSKKLLNKHLKRHSNERGLCTESGSTLIKEEIKEEEEEESDSTLITKDIKREEVSLKCTNKA